MKQIMHSLLAITICCMLLFITACGEANGESQGNTTARGRYVESTLTLPQGRVNNFYLQSDESLNLLIYDNNTNDPAIYNTGNFTSWQPVETNWYEICRRVNT